MGAAGTGECGVWCLHWFLPFFKLQINACNKEICLCALPGALSVVGSPNNHLLVPFGSELPVYTFIVMLSSYPNLSFLVAPCRGVLGDTGGTSPAPLYLAYPRKGACEAARGRVCCQFKAKVPGSFFRDGVDLRPWCRIQVSQSPCIPQAILSGLQLLLHQNCVVPGDTHWIWCPIQISWFSSWCQTEFGIPVKLRGSTLSHILQKS